MAADILIIPNRSSGNPTIQFTGSSAANIKMEVLPAGQVSYIGNSGSLFNITDNLIGSLMAVGDASGLPILEVFSDDRVVMGKYNANTLYVSGTKVGVGKVPLNAVLDVSGSAAISGSATVTGSFTANGRVTFNNGGTGGVGTLTVAGDITTYRSSNSGVIYFGSGQSNYLYYDGTNYNMPSGQLYVNGTQVVLNSGTWGISITGTAAGETLATVTGRGASTSTAITTNKITPSYNSGVTGATAPGYTQTNIEMYTTSNNTPAIGFHRSGVSATALYEYDGELYVNPWTTRAQTGKILTVGNAATDADFTPSFLLMGG